MLLGLRIASVGEQGRVAELTGLAAGAVADQLARAEADGAVRRHEGVLTGWALTPTGRQRGERLLADEAHRRGLRPLLEDAHRRFVELNPRLLAACTRWQVREVNGAPVPNDHGDAAHDAAAIAALAAVDEVAQPLCTDLASVLVRFASYGPRLAHARSMVEGGDGNWFTRLTLDSYHSVWFELHEHLLASLGIDRADERSAGTGP